MTVTQAARLDRIWTGQGSTPGTVTQGLCDLGQVILPLICDRAHNSICTSGVKEGVTP